MLSVWEYQSSLDPLAHSWHFVVNTKPHFRESSTQLSFHTKLMYGEETKILVDLTKSFKRTKTPSQGGYEIRAYNNNRGNVAYQPGELLSWYLIWI